MRMSSDAFLDAAIEDDMLRSLGVVEPYEPTPFSHMLYMQRLRAAMRTCPHWHSCIACSDDSGSDESTGSA